MERNRKFNEVSKERGITLVALIITIIVMLILVAVTVSIVVESDIITTAETAGTVYNEAHTKDQIQANQVTVAGGQYATLEQYTCSHATYEEGFCTECGAANLDTLFTFIIKINGTDTSYTAPEGATWQAMCNHNYGDFTLQGNRVYIKSVNKPIFDGDNGGNFVDPSATIREDGNYLYM